MRAAAKTPPKNAWRLWIFFGLICQHTVSVQMEGWRQLRRREALRLYRRFKLKNIPVEWHPSKENLVANLRAAWRTTNEPLPIEVVGARCRFEKISNEARRCDRRTLSQERYAVLQMRQVKARNMMNATFKTRSVVDAIVDDILHPQPDGVACGNIWGFGRAEKRERLIEELRRTPNATCYYLELEHSEIVAFAMYDEHPDLFTLPVGIPKYPTYKGKLSRAQFRVLLQDTLKGDVPNKFHELIFMCARPDTRRFGTHLFEAMLSEVRAKHSPVTLVAGQAKHMRSASSIDYQSTKRVADKFYKKYWHDIPVVLEGNRVKSHPRGSALAMDCEEDTLMRIWAMIVV